MNKSNKYIKELTGKDYQELAQYMMESRRILIDALHQLEKKENITSTDFKNIWKEFNQHFQKNYPDLLSPI